MDVKIKRVDTSFPLPAYQTSGAAAFDIYSRVAMEIPPQSLARIPTNLIIETPSGYVLLVAARSGLPSKKGLIVPHGMGVIDPDFCGNRDEILFQVYNITNTTVTVTPGERLAQGLFVHIDKSTWIEVESMVQTDRGGFGSTGV